MATQIKKGYCRSFQYPVSDLQGVILCRRLSDLIEAQAENFSFFLHKVVSAKSEAKGSLMAVDFSQKGFRYSNRRATRFFLLTPIVIGFALSVYGATHFCQKVRREQMTKSQARRIGWFRHAAKQSCTIVGVEHA